MSRRNLHLILALNALLSYTTNSVSAENLNGVNSNKKAVSNRNPSECPTIQGGFVSNPTSSSQQAQDDRDLPFQCMRRYFLEATQDYDLQFIEKSIDEKAANSLYMANIVNPWNDEISTFSAENAHLMRKTAGRKFNEQHCAKHLNAMMSILDELKHITQAKRQQLSYGNTSLALDESHFRLVKVLDSFGRYEPSLIAGRHLFMGSYTQCHGTYMILDKQSQTNTMVAARYCTAQLKIDNHLNEQLVRRKKFPHEMRLNIKVGICIPETCHTISFDKHRQAIQKLVDTSFQLPSEYYIEQHPQVESIFCGVDEDSEAAKIPFSGKLLICFLICWLSVVTYSTYREISSGKISKGCAESSMWLYRIYHSMSLGTSFRDFLCLDQRQGEKKRVDLDFLNHVKIMMQMMVVSIHSGLLQWPTLVDVTRFYANNISFRFFSLGFRLDTLFTVSGILIINSEFKSNKSLLKIEMNSKEKLNWFFKIWFRRFLKRYLRLVPLLFLVVWFKKSLWNQLSYGPLWDYGFNSDTLIGGCQQESWFASLYYHYAFNELNYLCEPVAWYIANEIFFIVYFTPIIALTIVKPKLALITGIFATILSVIAMIYGLTTMPPHFSKSLQELRVYSFQAMYKDYSYLYAAPYYHSFAYLTGIYCGYLLHKYNENSNKQWPKWMVGKFSKICLVLLVVLVFELGLLTSQSVVVPPPFMFEFIITGERILTTLVTAILFLRALTDCKDMFLIRINSTKIWAILANLSYSIYITHWDFIFYERSIRLSPEYYSGLGMFLKAGSHIFYSIIIGLIFHLLFENPLNKLVQNFIFNSERIAHKSNELVISKNYKDKTTVSFPESEF